MFQQTKKAMEDLDGRGGANQGAIRIGSPPPAEGNVPIPQSLKKIKLEKFGPVSMGAMLATNIGRFNFAPNDRLRVSIAWDTCVGLNTRTGPGPSTVADKDYDLVLWNEITHQYVTGSQSADDNNEGFDFSVVGPDVPGLHDVYIVWSAGTTLCNAAPEPIATALTWWCASPSCAQ